MSATIDLAALQTAYNRQIIAASNPGLQWHIKTLTDFLEWLGNREIETYSMLKDVMHEYADAVKLDDDYEDWMRNMSLANYLVWHKTHAQLERLKGEL